MLRALHLLLRETHTDRERDRQTDRGREREGDRGKDRLTPTKEETKTE